MGPIVDMKKLDDRFDEAARLVVETQKTQRKEEPHGGQIENITRKREISYILYGVQPDYEEIKSYCSEEMITSPTKRKAIGF